MDQGAYNKALKIYTKLYQKNTRNVNYLGKLVDVYHQLGDYQRADSLLKVAQSQLRYNKSLYIERGYNYSLMGKDSLASVYYQQAITYIDSMPNRAYSIARTFEQRNLLDQAIAAYEKGMQLNPNSNYNVQLAQLYGEKGDLKGMFNKYIDLIESNPAYRGNAQAIFSRYVTDQATDLGNKELRIALLLRLRNDPNPIYHQLLSWLFVQQKDFYKAFLQEKALYLRERESMNPLKNLAITAIEEGANDTAGLILDYIIKNALDVPTRYTAKRLQIKLKTQLAIDKDIEELLREYEALITEFGRDERSFQLQLDYAQFLAFKANQAENAIKQLQNLENQRLSKFQDADVKMLLADILVLQEQFNRALILYSQIQSSLPNDELAQTAQFKVARTSYFQGDFEWSLTQLKVLRSAASKLIANDAMKLSLVISDHKTDEDSLFVGLNAFAKADLKKYQNKNQEAIQEFDFILENQSKNPIIDDALIKQAQLYAQMGAFDNAVNNYNKLIKDHPESIWVDDALYELGILYAERLENPERAKELFEKIIYQHADCIHFVDARRRYRKLRGDTNTKAF